MTSTSTADDDPESRISARQQRILAFVREWVSQHGYAPSVREIGDAVGLASPSSVKYQLGVLERHGLIRRAANSPRALDLTDRRRPGPAHSGNSAVTIPLLGRIAAGAPLLADDAVEDHLTVPTRMVGHGTLFALTVVGDSMIEAAICDGDVVVVRQQPTVENGEIVAALLGDEATVKVYRRRGRHVELVPRNRHYDVIDGDHAVVLGKVVCVLRTY
ncbi:transcriptional repressor LexA [Couchioplanes caeruleus]|uniref:LexA repressor n=1 Tax=Couchioplanes caeruleus subsp. caeruleus TaxID=56427 RepID=A0A1K0FFF3_9ACTN|nr:transcriptional repressor LexA [Couchioplanes caeruleus]OJF11464.1 repressor LexA [Couchioplanes caeruleus subsp. caeruleus]